MKKIILCVLCLYTFASFGQWRYPSTKTADSVDTYFGIAYKDPYQWIENLKDTSVVSWFKQQADFSIRILNNIAGRDGLIGEWQALDQLQPPKTTDAVYENGRVFYKKTMPGEKVGKLYYREGLQGEELLLFDPNGYIAGKTLTIESFTPSFDGKQIAIAYSQGGAEISTLKVLNVDSRKFLPDEIYPVVAFNSWTFDNKGFLYFWQKSADNSDPHARLNCKTKLHVLHTDSKEDRDYFSNVSYPDLKIDPGVFPFAYLTEDNKSYVFGGILSVQPEYSTYYAPIEQLNSPKIQWRVLCTPENKLVRGMELVGDKVYAITYEGAQKLQVDCHRYTTPRLGPCGNDCGRKTGPNSRIDHPLQRLCADDL